jgi:hypothetical protein
MDPLKKSTLRKRNWTAVVKNAIFFGRKKKKKTKGINQFFFGRKKQYGLISSFYVAFSQIWKFSSFRVFVLFKDS